MPSEETYLKDYVGFKITVDQNGEFHGSSDHYDNKFYADTMPKLLEKIATFVEKMKKGNLHPKKVNVFNISSEDLDPATIVSIAENFAHAKLQVWVTSHNSLLEKNTRSKETIMDYSNKPKFCLANDNNKAIKAKLDEQDAIIHAAQAVKRELVKGITDLLTEEIYLASQKEEAS